MCLEDDLFQPFTELNVLSGVARLKEGSLHPCTISVLHNSRMLYKKDTCYELFQLVLRYRFLKYFEELRKRSSSADSVWQFLASTTDITGKRYSSGLDVIFREWPDECDSILARQDTLNVSTANCDKQLLTLQVLRFLLLFMARFATWVDTHKICCPLADYIFQCKSVMHLCVAKSRGNITHWEKIKLLAAGARLQECLPKRYIPTQVTPDRNVEKPAHMRNQKIDANYILPQSLGKEFLFSQPVSPNKHLRTTTVFSQDEIKMGTVSQLDGNMHTFKSDCPSKKTKTDTVDLSKSVANPESSLEILDDE